MFANELRGNSERGLQRLLRGRCTFCLESAKDRPWCSACFVQLPWNEPACQRCAEPLASGVAPLCGRCLVSPPTFARTWASLRYEGEVAALLQRFKFNADWRAGVVLAALTQAAFEHAEGMKLPQAFVALPRHAKRARKAGFDPPLWLTRQLARHFQLPYIAAQRLRATPTQRGLDRRARRDNVRGAFYVEAALPPRVVIIDDLMTTGASLDALAAACLAAGAEEVVAWAMARTPLTESLA